MLYETELNVNEKMIDLIKELLEVLKSEETLDNKEIETREQELIELQQENERLKTIPHDKLKKNILISSSFSMNEDIIICTPKLSKLNEQLNCLEKSKKYDFNDKERYGKFYKRIMDKLRVNFEENKELLKVELIRLKEESKTNNNIELTTEEIEALIEQLDLLISM
jgi:hypothetical protein